MSALPLIVGNGCSLMASITDALSTSRKTAKGVLWVQNISQIVYFIGTIALKGYSSAVQNMVSVLRNLAAIRGIKSKILEWTLFALGIVFGIAFNNLGVVGYLPVIANAQYTLVVFRSDPEGRILKISFTFAVFLFTIFNFAIQNYVGGISNLVVSVTTCIFLIRDKKPKKS